MGDGCRRLAADFSEITRLLIWPQLLWVGSKGVTLYVTRKGPFNCTKRAPPWEHAVMNQVKSKWWCNTVYFSVERRVIYFGYRSTCSLIYVIHFAVTGQNEIEVRPGSSKFSHRDESAFCENQWFTEVSCSVFHLQTECIRHDCCPDGASPISSLLIFTLYIFLSVVLYTGCSLFVLFTCGYLQTVYTKIPGTVYSLISQWR